MRTGWKVSGTAHLALMLWVVLDGTLFRSRPPAEMQVSDVSLISAAEYSALMSAAPQAPVTTPEPAPPAPAEEVAIAPVPEDRSGPPSATPRPPGRPPAREAEPDVSDLRAPPRTEADDRPPAPPQPPAPGETIAPPRPDAPPPPPVERVAPRPTPAPPEDVARADESREAVRAGPVAAPERPAEDQPAAAPEAAAPEIVTEAERAPRESPRPRPRADRPPAPPAYPAPPRTAAPSPDRQPPAPEAPAGDAVADAIAADLARQQASAQASAPAAPQGPPLTGGERDALRIAVQECWNVGALASAAMHTTVTLALSMNPNGTPRIETIRMIGASGGDETAVNSAFEAARRAIIRCGRRGFPLPAEKYEQWRDMEITFNPENMRIR